MINQWVKKIVLISALVFGVSVQAGIITDTEEVNALVGTWGTAEWTHDLSDHDFVLGSAESATLSIQFWDDSSKWWDLGEMVSIIVGTIDFLDGSIFYTPTSDWSGALGLNSLAGLNSTGQLDVAVWSLFGDFYIGNSVLEVTTTQLASVPEPGSLILFSLGLLGLGLLRRKSAI